MNTKVSSSSRALRLAIAVLTLCLVASGAAFAQSSQDRARQYYQEGKALFGDKQYAAAIEKFKAADKLAPAALLDFNIGLAYDAAGDRSRALTHYKRYLSRDPNASNRAAVEAKINRIEGELRSEAARKAEEDAARAAAAEEAAKAAAAEEAAKAEAARKATRPVPPVTDPPAADPPAADPPAADPPAADPPVAEAAPEEDTGPDPFARTGDPELDNVAAIDVTAIRARRGLASSRGDDRTAAAGTARADGPPPAGDRPPPPVDDKPKSKPVYKQWWFWVIVGVSAVILIDIATTGDENTRANRLLTPMDRDRAAPQGGAVLLRF